MCADCLAKQRTYQTELRATRRKFGVCIRCGRNDAAIGRKSCMDCCDIERDRSRRLRAKDGR